MKRFAALLVLVFPALSSVAHEIEGTVSHRGTKLPPMSRTQVPFASSIKESAGRTYILWIAPDGAIAFHIEPKRMEKGEAPLTHIWMIHVRENLKMPQEFGSRSLDEKSGIDGVESMKGPFRVDWGNDLDYTIYLDVKGTTGTHAFRGFLYGSPQNAKI